MSTHVWRRLFCAIPQWALIACTAMGCAFMAIVVVEGGGKYLVALCGGISLVFGVILSGNPRLFFLYAVILTAPLDFSKRFIQVPHMGGASAIRIELIDIFLIPLIIFILRDFVKGRRKFFLMPAPLKWWLLLALLGGYFIVMGPFRTNAFLEIFRMLKLTVLMLVVVNEVVRRKQFEHLAAAMLLSMIVQSTIGILQYINDKPLGLTILGEATPEVVELLSKATLEGGAWVYRISALLGHANLFSIFLSSQLPIALALLFANTRFFVKLLSITALFTGCIALILTLSRTGWVTAAASMGAVMLLSFFHPKLRAQFLVGRLAILIGGAAVGLALSGKIMKRLFQSDEGAVDVRFQWLEVAWGMIVDKPILGWGLNTFVFQMGPYTEYGSYDKVYDVYGANLPVVHNVYALVTAEQGFVGFFIFLIFVISVMIMAFKALLVKQQVMHALALGSICGYGVYLLDWLASFSLRMDHMGRTFFILLGLIAAINYWRIHNEKRNTYQTQ